VLEGDGWSAPRPGRFTPGKDPVSIVLEAGWAPGPVWTCAKNPLQPGIDPRTVQPVISRYTDWATRLTSLYSICDKWIPNYGGRVKLQVRIKVRVKNRPSATLSTTNSTWTIIPGKTVPLYTFTPVCHFCPQSTQHSELSNGCRSHRLPLSVGLPVRTRFYRWQNKAGSTRGVAISRMNTRWLFELTCEISSLQQRRQNVSVRTSVGNWSSRHTFFESFFSFT
jgi:hypothetical protein